MGKYCCRNINWVINVCIQPEIRRYTPTHGSCSHALGYKLRTSLHISSFMQVCSTISTNFIYMYIYRILSKISDSKKQFKMRVSGKFNMSNYFRLLCVSVRTYEVTYWASSFEVAKPRLLLIISIVKMTYWRLFNADKQNHNTNNGGTVELRLAINERQHTHTTMQVSVLCKQMTNHFRKNYRLLLISLSPVLVLLCRASFD